MIHILIFTLFITTSESNLKLVFSDEFNESDSIDQNKWSVEHEDKNCNGNHINQLNCKTNSKTNLRVIDGTLVLAAIRHKYLNKEYTAPLISTIDSFTYGRFEMRVSLPKGKMLRPAIVLFPTSHNGEWPKDGEIDMLVYTQTQHIKHGIHFGAFSYVGNDLHVVEDLNDFQTYILEWTESEITMIYNNRVLHRINTTEVLANNYNPFDKPFKLKISLGIGGNAGNYHFFPGQTLTARDAEEWNCSLLIFDYIRIYQNVTEDVIDQGADKLNQTESSSKQICNKVMPTIRNKLSPSNNPLIFSDEFDGSNLDEEKWDVEHEIKDCDGNHNGQLHCKTNSPDNIRLFDGTLVLAAIRQKYLKKDFTAPLITTKKSFTYGRFEIRAALPDGKMLRPSIHLVPTERHNNHLKVWSKDGLIEILSNTQLQEFYYGIHYSVGEERRRAGDKSDRALIKNTIYDFHSYVFEWTPTELRWMLDDNLLFTVNMTKKFSDNYNPFDKPFKLVISLGVGGNEFFPGQILTEQDADDWKCSLLILDYIRIYETDGSARNGSEAQNKETSDEICNKVMPLIRKGVNKETTSSSLMTIISISSFFILLLIIPVIIFIFIRMKNLRQNGGSGEDQEPKEIYELYDETTNNYNTNTYTEYETIDDNCNQYTSAERRERESNAYLKMTNKTIESP